MTQFQPCLRWTEKPGNEGDIDLRQIQLYRVQLHLRFGHQKVKL